MPLTAAMTGFHRSLVLGPMFSPAVLGKPGGPYAVMDIGTLGGGTNWPGAGFNPETHVVFTPAANAGVSLMGLVEPPAGLTDNKYLEGTAGQPFRINGGPGFGSSSDAPKVSADDAKLAAILAAHPQTATAPPPPRNIAVMTPQTRVEAASDQTASVPPLLPADMELPGQPSLYHRRVHLPGNHSIHTDTLRRVLDGGYPAELNHRGL